MFYLESEDKKDCFGCTACLNICPVKCIDMQSDKDGFQYPVKDKAICIDCNLCRKVCPNANNTSNNRLEDILSYSLTSNDKNIVEKSSSGGAFSAIAQAYCDKNYAIFGVEIDCENKVKHSHVEDIKGIDKFRKSKYVQSYLGNTYFEVKEMLDSGSKVLFTGTPCQVAGLKLFLRREYANLFCVDIICHGVPSQKVLDKYIEFLSEKTAEEQIKVTFRHKTCDNGKWESRNMKIDSRDKVIVENNKKNYYLQGFHRGLFYRTSCYECKYANHKREGDITIGDFWGVKKVFPNENPHKGVSEILVNTKKGKEILDNVKKTSTLKPVSIQTIIKYTGQLNIPTMKHPKREVFFASLDEESFDDLVEKCISNKNFSGFVRRILSFVLPREMKYKLKKLLKGVTYYERSK